MSYSRWMHSYWYTYWSCHPEGSIEDRDTALFEICAVKRFTAKELRDDIEGCLAQVKEAEATPGGGIRRGEATDRDYQELRLYIQEFLEDVDERYPVPTAN